MEPLRLWGCLVCQHHPIFSVYKMVCNYYSLLLWLCYLALDLVVSGSSCYAYAPSLCSLLHIYVLSLNCFSVGSAGIPWPPRWSRTSQSLNSSLHFTLCIIYHPCNQLPECLTVCSLRWGTRIYPGSLELFVEPDGAGANEALNKWVHRTAGSGLFFF